MLVIENIFIFAVERENCEYHEKINTVTSFYLI